MVSLMNENALIAAASFETRSTYWVRDFLNSGGEPETVFLADVIEHGDEYAENLHLMRELGVKNVGQIDRFSSESLWRWVVGVVERASVLKGNLTIDVTCMPRELLGMLLFAVSVKRQCFSTISIAYVSAPAGGYATQNEQLPESARWLSKGVACIRSIVGYPGVFRSERPCHLVVFAGHELERILQLVEYVEPRRLTISGELEHSSTVPGAREISWNVAQELKRRIQVPEINDIEFSSSSIDEVYSSLIDSRLGESSENVALAVLNTKLSFVGAALFALSNRTIRMMYTVPREYNPLYCEGVGDASRFDITSLVGEANHHPNESP